MSNTVLYRIDDMLVSEDLKTAYHYDGWCLTPAAKRLQKLNRSGSFGSFGGRNFQIGVDIYGKPIMSEGVWYAAEVMANNIQKYITEIEEQKAMLKKELSFDFSDVIYSTIRECDDELHIEVRFKDGQKFAAITIDKKLKDAEKLANHINNLINK